VEQELIRRHLASIRTPLGTNVGFSGFTGGLQDARQATGRHPETGVKCPGQAHGSWLGTIGYMSILDQIGTCFTRAQRAGALASNTIVKALLLFAAAAPPEAEALYALRCSLAHDYSLSNVYRKNHLIVPARTHHFYLCVGTGRVVSLPRTPWDGEYNHRNKGNETTIDVEAFGDLVEGVYQNLLTLNDQGELMIALKLGAAELVGRYSFQTFG
jgi:hypothetical protein